MLHSPSNPNAVEVSFIQDRPRIDRRLFLQRQKEDQCQKYDFPIDWYVLEKRRYEGLCVNEFREELRLNTFFVNNTPVFEQRRGNDSLRWIVEIPDPSGESLNQGFLLLEMKSNVWDDESYLIPMRIIAGMEVR